MLHGGDYPSEKGIPQTFNLTLYCKSEATEPKFISYETESGVAVVEWSTPAACAKSNDDTGNTPKDPIEPAGSGVGWFFLL